MLDKIRLTIFYENFMYYFCLKLRKVIKIKHLFILITIITVLSSCKKEETTQNVVLNGHVFGTTYNIKYLDVNHNYQKSIDSLFYLVNRSLSTYIPTSDISKINNGDTTVVVDDYFLEVFQKSKKIFKETNGFFDPTVGNLVNSWGFGPKNEKRNLSEDEVKNQMQFVGLDKVIISDRKIIKEKTEIFLDFNSIAKGYGIDIIGRFLESKNVENYLVEIGGEIRARGNSSKGKPWKIGFDNPNTDGSRSVSKFISLSNKSMATSGNYRKFRITDAGKKYVHTVNPKTGFAIESNLLSASVISNNDCADVDAYATAFMAMGIEKTKEFLKENPHVQAILLYLNENEEVQEFSNFE